MRTYLLFMSLYVGILLYLAHGIVTVVNAAAMLGK